MPRPYEIVALAERTPAWWDWRRSGIGSSDAATILGIKPAKSAERLLFEKQHPPKDYSRSFTRAQGVALERAARAHYCATFNLTVQPVCVQNLARPWQRASLDGLSAHGDRVVEIKCGHAAWQRASSRRRPPPHHLAQLQHILAVTGLPAIDYWCYSPPHPPLHLEIARDEPYIARLLAAEEVFWRRFAPSETNRAQDDIRRDPRDRVARSDSCVRVDLERRTAPMSRLASHTPPSRKKATSSNASASWVIHRRSSIHGRGVFARRAIPDGTRILEYAGERITKAEAFRREAQRLERQRRGGDDSVYLFVLNQRYDLDGRKGGSIARFINHSCQPNCRTEIIRGRVWIVARRDIAANEELTYDYGFSFREWHLHPCRCGAPRCAGFIVGSDQRWRLRRIPLAERRRHKAG